MQVLLPFEPLGIVFFLRQAGFEAYLVGGAVRDLLVNSMTQLTGAAQAKTIVDFDITTNATPEQIQAVFPQNFYENDFGTVSVTHSHLLEMLRTHGFSLPQSSLATTQHNSPAPANRVIDSASATKLHQSLRAAERAVQPELAPVAPFEITTYRSEGIYRDHRRPSEVTWGTSISEDLQRRDFTINALALSISDTFFTRFLKPNEDAVYALETDEYELLDIFGGVHDLAKQVIVTVGNPTERFSEDALRMLRAIRIAAQLGFTVAPETLAAIANSAQLLSHISGERIRDELLKLLGGPEPKRGIELLDSTGLLSYILPELLESKGVAQGGHHTTDVWTHSLDALATCPSSDPLVRLATLIHDVGKPRTYALQNGSITFYNHEIVGSRMATKIAKRLRLSNRETERVFLLVRHHMFYYQPEHTDASIRRFMRNVGLENIDDILALREGDRLGSGARQTSWRLEEMKQRMIEQLHQPMDASDLAVDGHDLMREFSLNPGRLLGTVLRKLLEEVLENPELNTKDALLERAKVLIAENSQTA